MTRVFNPFLEKVAAENLQNRDAVKARMNMRMCWTCQQEKPIRGGAFPSQAGRRGARAVERFRCADCTQRLFDKKAAQEVE